MMQFIFGQTDWYKKILHDKYVEENKDFPTGHLNTMSHNLQMKKRERD